MTSPCVRAGDDDVIVAGSLVVGRAGRVGSGACDGVTDYRQAWSTDSPGRRSGTTSARGTVANYRDHVTTVTCQIWP